MATTYDPEEYIAALGNLTPLMRDEIGGIEGITDINGQVNIDNLNKFINGYTQNQGYNMPINMQTDPTYSSGLNYAQSIAGGQNVPNMIAPGISYSAEQPGGYTQADLNGTPPPPPPVYKEPDDPSFFGTGIGGVRIHQDRKNIPFRNIFGNMSDVTGYQVPTEQEPPVQVPPQEFNIDQILQDITDSEIDIPNIQGPVDMPIPTDIPESLIIPKVPDELFIDNMARFIDIPSEDYKVPQVPLNNLLNQNPPQTPVGMSPQELAKTSSQQELLNLISNKDELTQIPADDGVRNQYQVELDEFINKSPINMDTYKEELPVGSAINLGIPAFMESVVPMAVPGLGLAKNISDSFQNDFSPSGLQSFEPSPVPSFTPGIDYSQVRRFGR
jgi:hypothetical protein